MWRWAGLFFISMLIAFVAFLPLGLVVHYSGAPLQAAAMRGTVWQGTIQSASFEGYPLGDIRVRAKLLPLLAGTLRAELEIDGQIAKSQGTVSAGFGSIRFDDLKARVDIATLDLRDAFGAPMSGIVNLTADNLRVTYDGLCRHGAVTLRTDTFRRSAIQYGGEGFELSGAGECRDDLLLLPLNGSGPEGEAEVMIRVSRNGYQSELAFIPADEQLAMALTTFGFVQNGSRYSLTQRGDVF